uniref:Secreted protein n=1 Tax=Phakopsora pachyrhizi TaxID=170000 RepID=A0A0S1MK23_PHAPC
MKVLNFSLLTILLLALLVSISQAKEDQEEISPLGEYFGRQDLESRGLEDDWIDISVGVMMKREEDNQFNTSSSLTKRSTGDWETSEILVARDPRSNSLIFPSSWSEASQMIKRDIPQFVGRHYKRAKSAMSVKITWYTGHDLLNPACVQGGSGWAPVDKSMAAAVTIEWPGKPKCGKFVRIQKKEDPSVSVVVRVVDSCGGCRPYSQHIDLTIGAFKKLYAQEVGQVEGLRARIVKAPVGHKWTKKDTKIYGPKNL